MLKAWQRIAAGWEEGFDDAPSSNVFFYRIPKSNPVIDKIVYG
jgi:hypothetical protein